MSPRVIPSHPRTDPKPAAPTPVRSTEIAEKTTRTAPITPTPTPKQP